MIKNTEYCYIIFLEGNKLLEPNIIVFVLFILMKGTITAHYYQLDKILNNQH